MFQPPRDRDAHAAIRGYVFQIDKVIDRWLLLSTDQSLELERGEDIDLVSRLMSNDGAIETESRLLEQIKHRETSVTLRTPAVLEALANFHDHRLANQDTDLRFSFLTNAVVGTEQLSPFPNRVPGIALWERVRTGQLDDTELHAAIHLLRQFLSNLAKPDSFSESVWSAWKTYLTTATVEEFKTFVDRFEWSTGQPDAEQLPIDIRRGVVSLGFAENEIDAQAVYDRLFVYVARLLGKLGVKRLTVDDRSRLLAEPTLSAGDRKVLGELRAIVAGNTNRLDRLEAGVSVLRDEVESLIIRRTSAERIELTAPIPDLSCPKSVARLSPRNKAVDDLCQLLSRHGWVSIYGGPDVGKSQLAIQVAAIHGGFRGWVRFHSSQNLTDAASLLNAALIAMAGWSRIPRHEGWYPEAVASIGANSLVIFDDLPRITSGDPFAENLIRFGDAGRAAGLRVLSTSQFELPSRMRHHFGDDWLHDHPAPLFLDDEARDVFRAYAAPDSFLDDRRLRFLNSLAAGHPLLLTATAEFLAARRWQYRDEEVEALLRGDHTTRVTPEVIERLTRAIGDSARELLYRLTLPIGLFEVADVTALAAVAPPVDRPRERFNDLLGAWVQRDTTVHFSVSPLVKPFGESQVALDVRTQCYRELADLITGKGVLNQFEGERAILYNMKAGEFSRATTLYVLFLVAAMKETNAEPIVRVIDRWRQTPLPRELSVGERLLVRAYQLAAFSKVGLDTQFIVRDIDELLGQATEKDGWGIVALAGQNLSQLRTQDTARALKYVRRAVELPVVYGQDGREVVFERISIPDMLWMLITDLRTPELLRQWFDAVEALPAKHRATFWESEAAHQGIWLVTNKLYLAEFEKPDSQRDWDLVLSTLRDLLVRAQRLNQPRLEATIAGLMMEIQGDRMRLDDIPAIAEVTLSRWPNEPDVQFTVRGTWGRIFAYHHRPAIALPLLERALSQPHSQNDFERLRCLLAANLCVAERDLRYVEAARDLARASGHLPPIEAARALGEYALSCYVAEGGQAGAIAAFSSWSDAVRQLFQIPKKDKVWRDLVVLFGHVTGCLVQLARSGQPPDQTIEGEPSVLPSRGFLRKDYSAAREANFTLGFEAGIFSMMHHYAASASMLSDCAYWIKLAIESSRQAGAVFIQAVSSRDAVAELVTNGYFEDAIEAAVFADRAILVSQSVAPMTRENYGGIGVAWEAEFRKLPDEKRQQSEHLSLITVMIPAALWIARMSFVDPASGISAARRVAAACRQLSADELGNRELWRTTAELFELASADMATATSILSRVQQIGGHDQEHAALRTLGYILATFYASPDDAIHCQLACIELLLKWFRTNESVRHRILLPYIESYWQHIARQRRFALRSPNVTVPSIEFAMTLPEAHRIEAILSAAAGGFRIRGLEDVVHRLRMSFDSHA